MCAAQAVQILVVSSHSLYSTPGRDAFLPQLNDLINNAFASQDRSIYGDKDLFTKYRIKVQDQLLLEIGSAGLLAIAFDIGRDDQGSISLDDAVLSGYRPVAIACIKPWKGRAIDLWKVQKVTEPGMAANLAQLFQGPATDENSAELLKQRNWEVCMCASRSGSRYRGQGLVTRCVDAVLQRLQTLRRQASSEGTLYQEEPLRLWVTVLEGVGNVEYWQRRGFERQGGPEDAPAGLWAASGPFKIGTLRKVLD